MYKVSVITLVFDFISLAADISQESGAGQNDGLSKPWRLEQMQNVHTKLPLFRDNNILHDTCVYYQLRKNPNNGIVLYAWQCHMMLQVDSYRDFRVGSQ